MGAEFPLEWVREQFPALRRNELFADNAAGTQVPQQAMYAMDTYLTGGYSLGGSAYAASRAADELSNRIRKKFTSFLGAGSPDEIQFGPNATTLFRLLATSLAETMQPGDEIILTNLDHEANITPWLRLQKAGITINYWRLRGPERILAEGDLKALINDRTRYLMVTGASNVLGTLTDLKKVCEIAHQEGVRVITDAVHLAPHSRINVAESGVDVLVGSGYKLFGPKLGFMYINHEFLEELPSLNHYFLQGSKFEIGAPPYEAMAAFTGTFEYLELLANQADGETAADAMELTAAYEKQLTQRMISGLRDIKEITLFGIAAESRLDWRFPTFALRHSRILPGAMAEILAGKNIHCRWGHMYAPRLIQECKLRPEEGVCRLSLAHYNTADEVDHLLGVLSAI